MTRPTTEELDAGLVHIRDAPADDGELRLIVRRPAEDEREVIDEGELDLEVGLTGDNWLTRGNSLTHDGMAHPLAQLTIVNSRVLDVVAGPVENWPAAGAALAGYYRRRATPAAPSLPQATSTVAADRIYENWCRTLV